MICVFDVETIPDTKLIRNVLHLEGEDLEISLLAMKEQEKKNREQFFAHLFS